MKSPTFYNLKDSGRKEEAEGEETDGGEGPSLGWATFIYITEFIRHT